MRALLLLSDDVTAADAVLPALAVLPYVVRIAPADVSALLGADPCDAILVDARHNLVQARSLCRLIRTTGAEVPLLAVVTEGGLAGVAADWGADEVLLDTAGPAEVQARLRLGAGRRTDASQDDLDRVVRTGGVVVDEATFTAKLHGRVLDLTFKEFELLRFLAQHPGRVFSRDQLLAEVWGYDYFGGTRTVDVHVRRLRAKLGPEHDGLIGTVRNVGYRFVVPSERPVSSRPRPSAGRASVPGSTG